jgi:hypothetical protein
MGKYNDGGQAREMFELVSHPSVTVAAMLVERAGDGREFFTIASMGIK